MFISVEKGDDMIVSFVVFASDLEPGDFSDVESLILMRSPQYEFALPESERGVSVSHEKYMDEERDYLEAVEFDGNEVKIATTGRNYHLNIRRVDPEEIEAAKQEFEKMNFDQRFKIKNV